MSVNLERKSNTYRNQNMYENKNSSSSVNILKELESNIFTSKNLKRFIKHTFCFNENITTNVNTTNVNTTNVIHKNTKKRENKNTKKNDTFNQMTPIKETKYKPKQKDSLFWCFYILKNGFSKYEMEIFNQYFIIEKQEKFKYIDLLRKNKDILKMHKIKPLTELEDDLANKERISIKTFFALCSIEKINIALIDKRKIYEFIFDDSPNFHVVHRDSISYEHYIELDINADKLLQYRESYYKVNSCDNGLKAMSSYKLEELIELCKKLDIQIVNDGPRKKTKKDIYELLITNF